MYKVALSLALLPAALFAQSVSGSAQASTTTRANVSTPAASANASAHASADAEIAAARSRGLPVAAMEHRVAEGRAKGASDAQLAASAHSLRLELESAHDAMVRAGRSSPSDQETERGAYLMERGYTSAQIEAVAKSAPSDRSLVVAFDVLTRLRERGVASARAVEEVSSKLQARASDESISALATTRTNAGVGLGVGGSSASGAASATGRANAATGAAVSGAGAAGSVAGSVTGAVTGAVKKP